jgi:MFS transporter, DHA1 family, tetracycline resistance protein
VPVTFVARPRTATVAFVLVVILLDTLGVGVILPVLPRLVESFVGGDVAEGSRWFGAFVSAYAAMQFFFAPIMGALSDRFGRRVVILTSLLGAALDYVLLAFAPSLSWLFVGRVVAGITGASFSAATAYIADITPPEKRAQSFGMVGAAFGVGFVLGPAVGGVLAAVHLRAPFLLAAGLNVANLIYGLFVLPESLAPEHRRKFDLTRANPLGALRRLGASPLLLGFTGTLVCAYLAQQILQAVWALYTQARFDWLPLQIGISLAIVGIMTGVVQGGLVRIAVRRLGEEKSVLVGLLFNVLGFVAFGVATEGWMMYALLVPFSLGGIAGPAIQSLLTRQVGPSEQGELQGSLASLQSVTAIVGPLVATGLFSRFAPASASPHVPGAPFFASATLNTLGIFLAWRLFARLNVKA